MRFWRLSLNTILLLTLLAAACDPGGPSKPEPTEVPVRLIAAEATGITGPIRLALVWRQGTGSNQRWISTFDTGLTTVPDSTRAWFDLPAHSELPALTDVTRAYVSCDEESEYPLQLSAAVPRLVAYEDRDQSEDFDPDLPLNPGQDRVLAVNPSVSAAAYIAGFLDLDATLARMPMEYAECLRTYTSGRYSAFFIGNAYSDYVWAVTGKLAATLELSPTPYAAVAMACDSWDLYSLANRISVINKERSTLVDDRVASDPCIDAPWQCSRASVASLGIPEPSATVTYPGFSRSFVCTAVGNLDVLWYVTETIDCNGCQCDWLHSHQAWVVDASQVPAGWPCGKQVHYCGARGLSIWEVPSYCSSVSLERPE
jgi:hypothetical protein